MTAAEVVFDASAVVRALTSEGGTAELFDEMAVGCLGGHAPDFMVAEVASAVALHVRVQTRTLADVQWLLDRLALTPIELHPTPPLAARALEVSTDLGLSAYDAFYAVLSIGLDAPLVTADRRLAEAVPGAVLVS